MSLFFKRGDLIWLAVMSLSFFPTVETLAQSVGIGTLHPNGHAVLDITSADHNQGFLMPRLSSEERLSMPLDPEDIGLMVFDIDIPGLFYWDGSQWVGEKDIGTFLPFLAFNSITGILSIETGNSVDLSVLMNDPDDELIEGVQLQNNQLSIAEAGIQHNADLNLLQFSGDVTGNPMNMTVRGLQGFPLQAQAPQAGDKLVFDGTSWVPESTGPVVVSTEFYTVAPADFVALYADEVSVDKNNSLIFASDNSFVTIRHNDVGRMLLAPVHLPHGATVSKLTAYYFDDHTPNLTISFVEIPIGGTMNVLDQVTSNENQAAMATRQLTPNALIDNTGNTYAVLVELDVTSETKNPTNDSEQGIYGIVIEYLSP